VLNDAFPLLISLVIINAKQFSLQRLNLAISNSSAQGHSQPAKSVHCSYRESQTYEQVRFLDPVVKGILSV